MSPPTNAPAADAGGTPDYGALRALLGPSLTPEYFIDRFWDAQPLALHANAREETDASAPAAIDARARVNLTTVTRPAVVAYALAAGQG